MNAPDAKPPAAWQPLTMRGVAAFAETSLGRLLLVQTIVALLAAGVVAWFLHKAWFPVIGEAIRALPAQGAIQDGTLDWSGPSPARLAEADFLAIMVDLDHVGSARSPAHVQVEFGRLDVKISSLLGYRQERYPRDRFLAFNRPELGPWWGAWSPAILAGVVGGVTVGLMLTWALLATAYSLPVWLIAFLANRDCGLGASWRLAGAALMPGALLICAAILLYGWAVLDPIRLLSILALHLLVGWVYLLGSPFCLPRHAAATPRGNPFA